MCSLLLELPPYRNKNVVGVHLKDRTYTWLFIYTISALLAVGGSYCVVSMWPLLCFMNIYNKIIYLYIMSTSLI